MLRPLFLAPPLQRVEVAYTCRTRIKPRSNKQERAVCFGCRDVTVSQCKLLRRSSSIVRTTLNNSTLFDIITVVVFALSPFLYSRDNVDIVDVAVFIAGDCWQTKMLLSSRAVLR